LIGSISFARVASRAVAPEQDIEAEELRVARLRGHKVVENLTLPQLLPRSLPGCGSRIGRPLQREEAQIATCSM
jgi:hypothetical protein